MYYITYGLLYLISLLPLFLLYLLSDFFYMLLYYIIGYRKKVVMDNLAVAFPGKSTAEKKAIAKQFYKNFTDTFIEAIKSLSMSTAEFDRRCTVDMKDIEKLVKKGKSIQLHSGHQMNWEFGNLVFARNLMSKVEWIGIYKEIHNPAFNKLFLKLRAKFGGTFVSTREFRTRMHTLFKSQYSIGLIADQNTSPQVGYWLYFFTKPVPFITGPEKSALKNNTAVVFVNFVKKKRGHYHFETKTAAENGSDYQPGELTIMYRDFLEASIRNQPANYLWTHKRWKYNYSSEFENLWMDTKPKP